MAPSDQGLFLLGLAASLRPGLIRASVLSPRVPSPWYDWPPSLLDTQGQAMLSQGVT